MSKRKENIKKLAEIHQRLDGKAKILYMAYKNGRLDLDSLNDDMRSRVVKLEKEESNYKTNSKISKKLDEKKIKNIKNALENIDKAINDEEPTEENDEEPELSEKLITKFNIFKTI